MSHFCFPCFCGWAFSLFHTFTVVNNVPMKSGISYFFEILTSSLLVQYSEIRFLDHVAVLFLIFLWCLPPYCFSPWVYNFTFSSIVHKSSSFSASSTTCAIFLFFLIVATITGVKWYFVVLLIGISLTISDVEHRFVRSLPICISYLKKRVFKSFANRNQIFWVWMLSWVLSVIRIWTPHQRHGLQIFSPRV